MSEFRVKHNIEQVSEDIELVLEDTSVLEDHDDILHNPLLSSSFKSLQNQHLRQIVIFIQARAGGNYHSYDPEHKQGILSKYDDVKEEVGFKVSHSDTIKDPAKPIAPISKPKPSEFAIPRKRMRVIDLVEGESRSENQEKFIAHKVRKLPTFEPDEDEHLELERSLNFKQAPRVKDTPMTQVGEEFEGIDEIGSIRKTPNDVKLSLKDSGSTSVVFLELPTERIQSNDETKVAEDWNRRDRPLGRGIGVCLELLRNSKQLGVNKAVGRKKDKQGESDILHFDNKGRVLSKKQAFRQQCYSFHNQHPSQAKLTKLQTKDQADLKAEKTNPAVGSESFKLAKSIMQKKQNPFVVISKL